MKTKDELVDLITNSPEEFNEYMEEYASTGIDLSEVDFMNLELRDIVFTNVDFNSSSFSDSHLLNVKFVECDLTSTDFARANVTECEFTSTIMNGSDFSYAVVDYCNFNESDLAGAIFQETDLTNSDLTLSLNLNACRFDDGTIWPDNEYLPDEFDTTYSSYLSSLEDDDEETVSDY